MVPAPTPQNHRKHPLQVHMEEQRRALLERMGNMTPLQRQWEEKAAERRRKALENMTPSQLIALGEKRKGMKERFEKHLQKTDKQINAQRKHMTDLAQAKYYTEIKKVKGREAALKIVNNRK